MRTEAQKFIDENTPPFTSPVNGVRDINEIVAHYEKKGHTCTLSYEDGEGIELKILNVE